MSSSDAYMLVIDVAHPPMRPAEVESQMDETLPAVRGSSRYRAIKVIHGYGSRGRGGSTKETVRNWAFRFRRNLRAVIYGEDFNLFDDDTQDMRQECGPIDDEDLGADNPGITILWVK